MGKGSARTLKHWIDIGYTETEAEQMRLSRTPGTFEYFHLYKGLSKDDAIKAKSEYQNRRSNTLDNMISKYGQIDGEIKWQIYKEKQSYSNSFEYKRDRYGWDYEQWVEYNKKRGNSGEKNPMYGTSYYEKWVTLYGKEIADSMNDAVTQKKICIGEKSGNYKRKKRPEELEKMKQSAINRVIRQGTCTAYNKKSIPIIEQYAEENGYEFQHAENGGEYHIPNTTYIVDGYDIDNNVVIEFDEKYHSRGDMPERDLIRQNEIGNQLKCKFIRIDEKLNVKIFDYSE
jgi:hypothetical protein